MTAYSSQAVERLEKENERLRERVAALEADCDRLSAEHAEDCQVHQANPPWRCTCDVARLRGRVTELEAALDEVLRQIGLYDMSREDEMGLSAESTIEAVRAALAGDGGGA